MTNSEIIEQVKLINLISEDADVCDEMCHMLLFLYYLERMMELGVIEDMDRVVTVEGSALCEFLSAKEYKLNSEILLQIMLAEPIKFAGLLVIASEFIEMLINMHINGEEWLMDTLLTSYKENYKGVEDMEAKMAEYREQVKFLESLYDSES
jgi:hypothetical protein